MLTIAPDLGKEEGAAREGTLEESVVLQLVEPFVDSGCHIVTDNFFTSLKLARKLTEKGMTLLGTIRSNKREIPKEMRTTANRERYSSKFAFQTDGEAAIVSYVPKRNKNVLLLTSAKCSPTTDDSSQNKKSHLASHSLIQKEERWRRHS